MLHLIKGLFGKKADLKSIYESGAIIVDVRTPDEFGSGHIKEAINIPLNVLKTRIPDLQKKNRPVITCCLSGARSAMAKRIIVSAGLDVYNGGPWTSLQKQLG